MIEHSYELVVIAAVFRQIKLYGGYRRTRRVVQVDLRQWSRQINLHTGQINVKAGGTPAYGEQSGA